MQFISYDREIQLCNGAAKKIVLISVVMLILLLFLSGCSSGEKTNSNSDYSNQQAAKEQIFEEISNGISQETNKLLYDADSVKVYVQNGKVKISVRTYADFLIPTVAEEVCPIALSAIEKTDYPLEYIQITQYYENEKDGMLTDTLVSWESKDGITGTFVSAPDSEHKVNCPVQDLYEYYSEYSDLVEKAKQGE